MKNSARAQLPRSAPTGPQTALDRTSSDLSARRETARKALIASSTSPEANEEWFQEKSETAWALLIL
jgi:hypothetical protein